MSAAEVIERIKELTGDERAKVAQFMWAGENSSSASRFSVATADDGLPVIRTSGGTITSQLVHEIESRTP